MKINVFVLFGCLAAVSVFAKGRSLVSEKPSEGAFSLKQCSIVYDTGDADLVGITASLLAKDILSVTGVLPKVVNTSKVGDLPKGNVVLLGTLGKNKWIDGLVSAGIVKVDDIRGGWEQYSIQRLAYPLPGVKQALVVVGCDRRGTAYGALALSEAMGVSPWVWWADVPVAKKADVYVVRDSTSKKPSVKYRGIFINDEDWGLKPWSSNTFETDLGDIGPRTYARVCELLLRLKGNMFAPAMHTCTGAFYSHPESKKVADRWGVIVTTSHCEPLLFNNAAKSEWDTKVDGDWNYGTNKVGILKKLDARVKEAAGFENIYTVGLRGLHDEGMRGNFSKQQKVILVDSAMQDERSILQRYIPKQLSDIPQIYVPYKEALDVYNDGLKVPDDVTLVWTDDNYGYIKRLSNAEEQKRSGGSGVYYHTSYLGAPHDYLWLCTTPPVLMYEELKKAYDTGADRYWLLNVGDIKPAELGMQTFFDMAWDVNAFDYASVNRHQSRFLAETFGRNLEGRFQQILDDFYRLAWSRKPEYMGWEREWDAAPYKELANTAYSFQNYNDAQQRLADYEALSNEVDKIGSVLPAALKPAFFEMLEYPVKGSYQMNRKFMLAQLNDELYKSNVLAEANWAAVESKMAFDSINKLSDQYNNLRSGKWKGMMAVPPGFVAKYQNMPLVKVTPSNGDKPLVIKSLNIRPFDIKPLAERKKLEGCTVIDLARFKQKVALNGQTLRVVEGLGYDWKVVQLGEATQATTDPKNLEGSRFEYEFSGVQADTVTVLVYSLPFFPLHSGKSNQFGVSVDQQAAFVCKNEIKEYSNAWKDQVLQNGFLSTMRFPVNKALTSHTLSIICGDPGMMVQRIIVDWGGLKKTYVGPGLFE